MNRIKWDTEKDYFGIIQRRTIGKRVYWYIQNVPVLVMTNEKPPSRVERIFCWVFWRAYIVLMLYAILKIIMPL